MKAYILTIGDEILIGQVTDTNATFMAAALNEAGYEVIEHLSVADTRQGIIYGPRPRHGSRRRDTHHGWPRPTKDDITKKVLADFFWRRTRLFTKKPGGGLTKLYQRFGREPNDSHREQCQLPASAEVLTNKRGTAPGMWLEQEGKIIVSMPGVPTRCATWSTMR